MGRGALMKTKTTTRRSFTDEFKREAVSLLASSGRPLTQIATELGIQPSMLRGWRSSANGQPKVGLAGQGVRPAAAPSAEMLEIRRLRRDLERVQIERDILKKAIGIFTAPPK
jgi:transposase